MTHDGEPDSYEYASRLATWIWEKHYKNESPHWKPLNDLLGVLTQIDNMVTGLVRAQPEQEIDSDRPHVENDGCPTEKAVLQKFWREHHAQPKQEPVAWMYDWYDETEDIDGVPIGGIVSDCISKDYDEAHSPTMGCHNIRPLYTTPPQRKWVGLTEMEVLDICNFAKGQNGFFFVREVEAKLKEKNGNL